jgi:hypothetical protein
MGYCEKAYVTIKGQTIECSSVKEKGSRKTEAVPTMNPESRAKGYKRGCVLYDIDLGIPMPKGDQEIDLYEVMENGEEFEIVIEHDGGATHSYMDGTIADLAIDSEDAKETTYAAACKALDRVKV